MTTEEARIVEGLLSLILGLEVPMDKAGKRIRVTHADVVARLDAIVDEAKMVCGKLNAIRVHDAAWTRYPR